MKFKSLKMFSDPIVNELLYPKRVHGMCGLEYEEKNLCQPYIGDQLDEEVNHWNCDRAVVITAPTGTGKTTFVVEKIAKKAVRKGQNVLIISNRNPLNLGYKKDIAKVTGCSNMYTLEGLQNANTFNSVYIVNYQGLQSFISENPHLDFFYVISDECHFFCRIHYFLIVPVLL